MSFLGDLVTQLLGEAAIDALRGSKKQRAPFPEGDTNASHGAGSAFLGSVGLLLVLPVALVAVFEGPSPTMSAGAILGVTAIGLVASYFGSYFGRRALLVTRRHLGLAKYGVVVSNAGLILSVVALAASAVRIFL